MWHPPAAVAIPTPLAVLMVGPWGAEDMSAHRAWRGLAQSISALGCSCLRFDLDGCGDAYDPGPEDDFWALWQASLGHAVETLKQQAGVQQVVVVGMRLGALLGTVLASVRGDIEALIVVAPVRSGKAYVRELRMLSGAMAQGLAQQQFPLFAAGFGLNQRTLESLSACELPTGVKAKSVAVIDREDLAMVRGWADSLSAQGVQTSYCALPGFPQMVLTAHKAQAAKLMFGRVLQAIAAARERCLPVDLPFFSAPAHGGAVRVGDHAELTFVGQTPSASVIESVIAPFGDMGITGILVEPGPHLQRSGKALLILNSSAERRIGPNRMWVGFSRARAASGDVVIRVDLPGLGDSLHDYVDEANLVYPVKTIEKVQTLCQHLAAQHPGLRWGVMGLCSGGYHSFRLSVVDARFERVFALNTFGLLPADVADFEAREQASLQHVVAQNTARAVLKPDRWLKLLRGQVDVCLILASLLGRVLKRVRMQGLQAGIKLHLFKSTPLMQALQQVTDRGCRVHFIFATTDPGSTMLKEGTAQEVLALLAKGSVTEDLVPNADHVFAGLEGRAGMLAHLHRRMNEWAVALPVTSSRSDRQSNPSSIITSTSSPAATLP